MPPARRKRPLFDETLGVLALGGGIFLLLSLLSLMLSEGREGGSSVPSTNWGGVVGYSVANTLARTLGSGALLVTLVIWQAGVLWVSHAPRAQQIQHGVGGLLFLTSLSPLVWISRARDPFFGGEAGGLAGEWLVRLLVPYCNIGGTLLSCAMLLSVGGLLMARPLFPGARVAATALQRLWAACAGPLRPRVPHGRPTEPRPEAGLQMPAPTVVIDPTAEGDDIPRVSPPPPPLPVEADGEAASPPPPAASSAAPTSRTLPYTRPPLSLLNTQTHGKRTTNGYDLSKNAKLLEDKLRDFGVDGRVLQVLAGPVVTMYEFEPASGIKVSRIVNLADDLALGMKALSVRIVAPVPGKAVVGIEIPNAHREPVFLRDILASSAFQPTHSPLVLALGKDILGTPTVTDLAQIPHLLIAGATGSGKSVGLNSMICSILFHAAPEDVKFIMIDPKMLELSVYDGIPHLIAPVVTHPKKAAAALLWAVEEMERRYRVLAERGVRSIAGYHQAHPQDILPYIVVVIDELADLIMVSHREVEDSLTRLAQMARAAGIHLLVATQRPSVDVLTGIIKANFPARISFQVSSRTDSRTILDASGAERLLGKGDMLFLPPGTSKLLRIHGAYVSEGEINRLVEHLRTQRTPVYDASILSVKVETAAADEAYDARYDEAVALVARLGQASASLMQRHLRIGYNRAARLLEVLEREGVVGPADGSRPREVYVKEIPSPPPR